MNEKYEKLLEEIYSENNNLLKDMRKRLSPNRWGHIEGCIKESYFLAVHYEMDPKPCMVAALLHDLFREMPARELFDLAEAYDLSLKSDERKVPGVLHGPVAAAFLAKNGYIDDQDILQGIAAHTLGEENLSDVGKILFIADAIEETRTYQDVEEMRAYVYSHTLLESYGFILREMFITMIRKGKHIFKNTVNAYNECMEELYDRN